MTGSAALPFGSPPAWSSCLRAALAASVGLLCAVVFAVPAVAQDEPEPTPTSPLVITESDADPAIDPDSPIGQIIPQPNSGARPERPGDRGGSLQLTLFALLLTFLAVAAWRVAVAGRRGRMAYAARAGGTGPATDTADDDRSGGPSGAHAPVRRGD